MLLPAALNIMRYGDAWKPWNEAGGIEFSTVKADSKGNTKSKDAENEIRENTKLALIQYTIDRLSKIEGVMVYGNENAENRTGTVAFNLSGVLPERIGNWLDQEYNISVQTDLQWRLQGNF